MIAGDSPPGGEDGGQPSAEGLKSLSAAIRSNAKPLAWMLGIWVLVAVGAYLVSRLWWRDDLSRSLIGAVALVLCAVSALAIFGVKGPKTLVAVLAAFGAVVAIGGGTVKVDTLLSDGPPQERAIVNCPPEPPDQARHGFVAETDLGYAHLRTEPNLSANVLLRYPPGCDLQFTSYCIGEPKIHWRFHDPDPVWFHALGDFHDGYIAGADIRAGPGPNSLPLGACPGGESPPEQPEITAPLEHKLKGPIEITAAAPNATEVGFAVYYEDLLGQPRSATWHQIGVDTNTGDGTSSHWDTRSIPGQSLRKPAPLTIAAVACLGLEFPFYEDGRLSTGMRSYVAANRSGPTPDSPPPPAESMRDAGQAACNNQVR
jgi:hypothetical protein